MSETTGQTGGGVPTPGPDDTTQQPGGGVPTPGADGTTGTDTPTGDGSAAGTTDGGNPPTNGGQADAEPQQGQAASDDALPVWDIATHGEPPNGGEGYKVVNSSTAAQG